MFKKVNGVQIPLTQIEIDARKAAEAAYLIEVATYEATVAYKDKRKSEYPPEGELIIAMWESLIENNNAPMNKLQTSRLAVKDKYPAPTIKR